MVRPALDLKAIKGRAAIQLTVLITPGMAGIA